MLVAILPATYAHAQFGDILKEIKKTVKDADQKGKPEAQQSKQSTAPNGQAASASDSNVLSLEKMFSLVAVLASDPNSINYWDQLGKVYPNLTFKDGKDKKFFIVKEAVAKIGSDDFSIKVLGARAGIGQVVSELYTPGGGTGLGIEQSKEAKSVCTVDDSLIATEKYFQVTLPSKAPILAKFERSGGSGGMTETLTIGDITLPQSCNKGPKGVTKPNESQPVSGSDQIALGYLKKREMSGGGCVYFLTQDEKKKNVELVAEDVSTGKLQINLNGTEIGLENSKAAMAKGIFDAKYMDFIIKIPKGKAVSCGPECAKEKTTIEITNSSNGLKKSFPVTSECGS
jgi:hypothetical protein